MEPCIRLAVRGDETALARLNAIVHNLHFLAFPSHFKPTDADEVAARFQSLLSQPGAIIWLAEIECEPVGHVIAQFRESPEQALCLARRWCEIDEIVVAPAWQNKGIGASLVRTVIARARAQGASAVELTTWCFNEEAQRAFERMGFTRKSIRYRIDVKGATEVLLTS